jgi:hypothetical protein
VSALQFFDALPTRSGEIAFLKQITMPIPLEVRSGLEDLKSIGKGDPAQIIIAFNVECLPK